MEAAGMSGYDKVKYPKPKRPKTKLGLPDLDHSKSASWTAFVHPSPNVAIDTPLMNLFSGTALSRDCRSTKLWSTATAFSLRIGSSRREPSMDDLLQYDGSPMRPQTLACSVRNSAPVFSV